MSVLELAGVSYTYPGAPAPALLDVDLAIAPGELVLVVGTSGSGKSTLLRVASGLVPHFHGGVFAGRASIAGLDLRDHGPGDIAAAVGTLFQDPETQIVMGSARAELAFPLENRGWPPAAVARGVEEAALALGVAHLLDRPTGALSGGELQRIALGAALAGRPSLLVLDEPTSQLDPVAGDELLGTLRRLNEDLDTAIVLAEHRLERCLGAADRVVALAQGRIVCDAPPAVFMAWAARHAGVLQAAGGRLLERLGLDPVPGVKGARAALRERGMLPAPGPDLPAPAGTVTAASRRRARRGAVLRLHRVWHEPAEGAPMLRGLSLEVGARERVAVMGRNGAGKSTLLRHAAGLLHPTRGRVEAEGRVALLLQNPGDYLVHETVAEEAPAPARMRAGLDDALAGRHPRELSGGERQRLALAVVLGDDTQAPAVLCLDEPTRGMDAGHRDVLAAFLRGVDGVVLVATHDTEFAAAFASRVVLLADGVVIADGTPAELLCGGSYFATETARILGGAGGALTPEQGARALGRTVAEVVA